MLVGFYCNTVLHHPSFWFCGPDSIDSTAQLNGQSGEMYHIPWSSVLLQVGPKINTEELDKKSHVVSYCLPLRQNAAYGHLHCHFGILHVFFSFKLQKG